MANELDYINLNGTNLEIRDKIARDDIGNMSGLTTTNTDSLVGAINEVVEDFNGLSTVARTGNYNDLTNKPNIQTITYNSDTSTLVIS